MRPAPSLTDAAKYPVTTGLALVAVVVTLVAIKQGHATAATAIEAPREVYDVLAVDVRAFWAEPWRLVTSALPHVGFLHLAFNVVWLWLLGATLEARYGHARFLALIVALQVPSAAAEYGLFTGGVGLSGVGYGLWGFRWALSRSDARYADDMDRRTTALFGIWFLTCIATTYSRVMPVANVAHCVGAITGMLLGYATTNRARVLATSAAVGVVVASLLVATTLRPRVNQSENPAQDAASAALRALNEKPQRSSAARHYLNRCLEYKSATTDCQSLLTYTQQLSAD